MDLTRDPNRVLADMTTGEMWSLREAMQARAATLLGYLLLEFSRVETNLSLCLVWVNGGVDLENLTPKVAKLAFHEKLRQVKMHVETKLPSGSKRRVAYDDWIQRTDRIRQVRNQLVHGRWDVDVRRGVVVNVTGLPTGSQSTSEYTLDKLEAVNEEVRSINRELGRIRTHWPL